MSRRGFTLIELLVAVAVFTLVATALVMSQVGALRAHRKAKEVELATQVSQRFIARLRAQPEEVLTLCASAQAPLVCTSQPCVAASSEPVCGEGVTDPEFYRVRVQYREGDVDVVDMTTYIYRARGGTEP